MSDQKELWYFAYGANMAASTFTTRRNIYPLRIEPARIETEALCFNIPGVPYSEPAMGGLRPRQVGEECVHGVAYQLNPEDFGRLIASEGGGIAYTSVLREAQSLRDGSVILVHTLMGRRPFDRKNERCPSKRYLDLLISGAEENQLPDSYLEYLRKQPTFKPMTSLRWRIGKWSFDSIWQPIGRNIQRGVQRFKDDSGHVSWWFIVGFDCLLTTMWAQHDFIHRYLWGGGDGS